MRVAHTADWHIRLLKRHKEYREVFKNFGESLVKNKTDLLIVAGDMFHNKVSLSPEAMNIGTEILSDLSRLVPIYLIPGNHDCIVNQPGRLDAITPVVSHLPSSSHPVRLFTKSGLYYDDNFQLGFGVFALNDEMNFPYVIEDRYEDYTYIALFHGAISKSVTDTNFVLNTKYNAAMFKEYDYAMLGDIHKYQLLKPRIAYPGSLIQQNFGEEQNKGYILWNINDGKRKFVKVKDNYGFYTLRIKESDDIEKLCKGLKDVPEKAYIRVLIEGSIYNQITLQHIASTIRELFSPLSLSLEIDEESIEQDININDLEIENVTQLPVQQKLLRKWFDLTEVNEEDVFKILNLHRDMFHIFVQEESRRRGNAWSVHKMDFSNTFSYGTDNSVNFDALEGLVGIFAPNKSGKSALLGTLLNGLFNMSDRVTRRNIGELINFNEPEASIELTFSINNTKFLLNRYIEKTDHEKNRGVSTVELWELSNGTRIPLFGDSTKNETERILRSMIGSYNDHSLITFGMQNKLTSFIDLNQAARKEILSRFLGLDVIDDLFAGVKTECDSLQKLIKRYKEHDFKSILLEYNKDKESIETSLKQTRELKERIASEVNDINVSIKKLQQNLKSIEDDELDKEDIEELIFSTESTIEDLEEEVNSRIAKVNMLETSIKESEEELNKFDQKHLLDSISKLADNREKLNSIRNSAILLKKDKKNNERMVKNLEKHDWFETNELCRKCSFLTDAFLAKDQLDSIAIELEEKLQDRETTSRKIDEYSIDEEEFERFKTTTSNREDLERKLVLTRMELNTSKESNKSKKLELQMHYNMMKMYERNEEYIEANKVTKEEIEKLEGNLEVFARQLKAADKLISAKSIELGSIEQKISDLDSSIQQLIEVEESFRLTSMLKDALSKDGIQLQIIKRVIPKINSELRKILSNVVDFDVILEIDDESKDIDIYIDDGISRRSLSLGSGMEMTIGAIALRAALANVSLIPKCNLFVIDEGFGTLDPEYLNNMNMLLGYLKATFKTVIIISHIESMQDIVDHIVTIERDEQGYSKLKIGAR